MADRAKFLDFMDMIDGGGAGKVGGEFQGGGIFSEIANMIATPYGSEDPERRRRLQERRRARGLLDMDAIGTKEEQAAAAARAAATPSVVKRSVPAVTSSPRPQLRPAAPATDPYAPLGGPNPAVQAEIQRRQEAQRMMGINQPMGAGGRAAAQARFDPYAPVGSSNPAVAKEIARRRAQQANARRMQSYEPVGPSTLAQPNVPMSAARLMPAPTSGAGYVGAPSGVGVTLGANMSGGSQPRMPMQEFAPQGQFRPPAESITRMSSPDFAVVDYLEANGIPVTAENVTAYRPVVMAAM